MMVDIVEHLNYKFSLNPKLCLDDNMRRMLRCILLERLPIIHVWKQPHNFDVTYKYDRYQFILNIITSMFAFGVSNIIYEYVAHDISFTKINVKMQLDKLNIVGNHICDTTINIKKSRIANASFYGVVINSILHTTFINCVFVNTKILCMHNIVAHNCNFISCVIERMAKSRFLRCKLHRCSFKCSELIQCAFIGCTMKKITMAECDIYDTKIVGSKIINWRIMATNIVALHISMSHINLMLISYASNINDIVIRSCHICEIGLCNVVLSASVFLYCRIINAYLINNVFNACRGIGSITDIATFNNKYKQCHFEKMRVYKSPLIVKKIDNMYFSYKK